MLFPGPVRPQWDPDRSGTPTRLLPGAAGGRAPLLPSLLAAAESIFVFYSTHIFLPPRAMIQSILQREEREGYSGRFFLYTQWVLVPRFPTQSVFKGISWVPPARSPGQQLGRGPPCRVRAGRSLLS